MRCPELLGDRVLLRSWHPSEADWYISSRDQEVIRWTSEDPHLAPGVWKAAIALMLDAPDQYPFAITDRTTGELLGNLPVSTQDSVATVGYWLAPGARGNGYLVEALGALVEWLPTIGMERVRADVHPDNAPSRQVLEWAGFKNVGEVESDAPWADTGVGVVYARESTLPPES